MSSTAAAAAAGRHTETARLVAPASARAGRSGPDRPRPRLERPRQGAGAGRWWQGDGGRWSPVTSSISLPPLPGGVARAEGGATRRAVSVCLPAAAAAAVLLMASCYSAAGHRIAFVEGPLG